MKKISTIRLMLLFAVFMLGVFTLPNQKAYAASAVKICAVSYTDQSILVLNNGNTKIYYATETEAAKGKWEVMNADATGITVIDISYLSSGIENILAIKGDQVATQARVIIKELPQKLDVSINYGDMEKLTASASIGSLLNIMATEGDGVTPITYTDLEWKKGDEGQWHSSTLLTKKLLESYLIKGTNLYFRISSVDDTVSGVLTSTSADCSSMIKSYASSYAYNNYFGSATYTASSITFGTSYPDGTKGRRASKAVKLKIMKMSSLPVTGIDGEEFKVDMKYGQEYRVTVNGGATPNYWTQVYDKSVKKLSLSTMIGGTYDGILGATAFPKMTIEVRTYATSNSAASKITTTDLLAQRTLSGNVLTTPIPTNVTSADQNIYVSYNGSKNILVTIPSASEDNPYEYCVVKNGATFSLDTANWTAITKGLGVKILSTKALDYSKIYFRMKEIKYRAASGSKPSASYQIASTCKTFDVNYPSVPTAPKTTNVYTKGYPNAITITVTLNEINKLPFETQLKYIKLGTKDIAVQSWTVTPSGAVTSTQVYTMTITLSNTALEAMTNCTSRTLSIYYTNGTVDKTSSKLTIKNATPAGTLTTTSAPGSATSTTAVTIVNALGTGNTFVVATSATEVTNKNVEDVFTTGSNYTSGADVTVTAGQYLTIYEINSTKNIIRYKSILVTAAMLK